MKKILLILFLLSFTKVTAQNIQILSEQDSTEVSFAIISYIVGGDTLIDAASNEEGKIMLQIPKEATFIEITSIGYFSKYMAVDSVPSVVYLKDEVAVLNEITLKSKKNSKRKTKKLGYPIKYKYYSYDVSKGLEVVTLFKDNTDKRINNFLFSLREPDIQTDFFSLFRIVFYKNKGGYPAERIYNKNDDIIKVHSTKCSKVKVNISHLEIDLRKEGLFIGLKYIGHIESNEKNINYTGKLDKAHSEEVGISFLKSKLPEAKYTYIRYKFNNKSNNWEKEKGLLRQSELKENNSYAPAFGIEVYE